MNVLYTLRSFVIPLKMFPELEKQASCSMCGKCCEAIRLPMPYESFEYPSIYKGAPFMHENFVPMTSSEAFDINPNLIRFTLEGELMESYYYSCKMYDKETKKCNAHDTRPEVCSGFPWYGHSINNQTLGMHLECSYWNDVPVEYWPTGVNI